MKNPNELASLFIIENKPEITSVMEAYNSGVSAKENHFGLVFANSAAEYAVKFVKDNKENPDSLEIASKRLGVATLLLNDSHFALALSIFIDQLPIAVKEYSEATKIYNKKEKLTHVGVEITNDALKIIAKSIHSLDDCRNQKRKVLIEIISGVTYLENKEDYSSEKLKEGLVNMPEFSQIKRYK